MHTSHKCNARYFFVMFSIVTLSYGQKEKCLLNAFHATKTFGLMFSSNAKFLFFKLVNINYKFKFSNIMYKFLYEMYREGKYKSPFLSTVETVLNRIGLSGMWTHQFDLNYSNQWFKSKVTRVLRDQYIHQWSSEIESKEIYYNYRMFKNVFAPEDYLQILPLNLAYTFVHFRTLNHRLPIQRGRVMNLPYEDRLCTKCSSADIGDEFHYVFSCPFLAESRKISFTILL